MWRGVRIVGTVLLRRRARDAGTALALLAVGGAALGGAVLGGPAFRPDPAAAAPSAPSQPAAGPGKRVCTITDNRLVELSGLVATGKGFIAVNDGTEIASREGIFFLDSGCRVTKVVDYPGLGPLDPEDLAMSPDRATLWIGDIGDNTAQRDTIALWRMPAGGGSRPVLFRLRYPDGAKDAEGLLVGRDGVPIVVTKGETAGLYKPAAPLRAGATVAMRKVGQLSLPKTNTANPLGLLGRFAVSGGTVAPDGRRVILRTLADAFEWDVPDGDVARALTSGQPRITPLPNEPQGEAIAYSPDGATIVTVSESAQTENQQAVILRYALAKAQPPRPATAAGARADADTRSWWDRLSLRDVTYLIGAVGAVGLVLVVLGVVGILVARRRTAGPAVDGPADDSPVFPDGPPAPEFAGPALGGPGAAGLGAAGPAAVVPPPPVAGPAGAIPGRPGGALYGGGYRGASQPDSVPAGERASGPAAPARSGAVYGSSREPRASGPAGSTYGTPRRAGAVRDGQPAGYADSGGYRSPRAEPFEYAEPAEPAPRDAYRSAAGYGYPDPESPARL